MYLIGHQYRVFRVETGGDPSAPVLHLKFDVFDGPFDHRMDVELLFFEDDLALFQLGRLQDALRQVTKPFVLFIDHVDVVVVYTFRLADVFIAERLTGQ